MACGAVPGRPMVKNKSSIVVMDRSCDEGHGFSFAAVDHGRSEWTEAQGEPDPWERMAVGARATGGSKWKWPEEGIKTLPGFARSIKLQDKKTGGLPPEEEHARFNGLRQNGEGA